MTFARTFSITSLFMLGLLVYGGIASAQTTSYIPGITSSTSATGTAGNATTSSTVNGTTSVPANGSVLGASTTNPNLPNTGAGGNAAGTAAALLASGLAALGGAYLLLRRRVL